ncbi:MAG TPA: SPFH domain-containing protein, partial [Kofleriaceae bacterium]|nr:SPFH domain-containing protein [Kofleriaceae bacterium]
MRTERVSRIQPPRGPPRIEACLVVSRKWRAMEQVHRRLRHRGAPVAAGTRQPCGRSQARGVRGTTSMALTLLRSPEPVSADDDDVDHGAPDDAERDDAAASPPTGGGRRGRAVHSRAVDRYTGGWRAGKPVEDPDKIKSWGFVAAKPSEYLVCTRRGQIDRKRSGQGARMWKWPWQSIAIVPTTLQRIEFAADQVTRERVGVRVSGIAVYRIAEPELAFRVLNFTYGEAANEKLATTLREMFIGASRRLIANLTLDDCLTRRKEAIGTYLMAEIAPVVGGHGAAGDTTDRGWGVVIDSIEIQDVRIQSPQVFAHLQAPYRAEIAARAQLAELERQRQVALRRAETERNSDEARVLAERDTRAMRARAEAEAAQAEARAEADAAQVRAAMAEAAH